jgi:hypothetical protein
VGADAPVAISTPTVGPGSSTTPSDSSSVTRITWRAEIAMNCWRSGSRAPSVQITSASMSAMKSESWALRKSVVRER